MIVIDPNTFDGTISVLPRYYEDLSENITVTIINENNRTELNHTTTNVVKNDGFLQFDTDAIFEENTSYSLKITDTLVVFRGKIFATNQSKQNYLING